MPIFHITFFLNLAPLRKSPYFSEKSYLDEYTITDPALRRIRNNANGTNPLRWNDFMNLLGTVIIMQTRSEFKKYTDAAGLTNDAGETAWHALSRSMAFFGVTDSFSLGEIIKNSLYAEAESIHFHICCNENTVTCIATDNGTGFINKQFRTLFAHKDKTHSEPLINYRTDVLTQEVRFNSPKRAVGMYITRKSSSRQQAMQILKPIDERLPAYGISVGGAGLGLAMILEVMKLGELGGGDQKFGGSIHLTNVEKLAEISTLADIRPQMTEFSSGSVIIFSSPFMPDDLFQVLKSNRQKFVTETEILYFLNLERSVMARPGNQVFYFKHPNAIQVRIMNGSVLSLTLASDLPVIEKKDNVTPPLDSAVEPERTDLRKRHMFFDKHNLGITPLRIDDSEENNDIVQVGEPFSLPHP